MNILEKLTERRRAAFMEHVGSDVVSRFDDPRPITLEEYRGQRMNSHERKFLLEKLNGETLLSVIAYCLNNSQPRPANQHEKPCATYDEALVRELLPELLNRQEFRKLVP